MPTQYRVSTIIKSLDGNPRYEQATPAELSRLAELMRSALQDIALVEQERLHADKIQDIPTVELERLYGNDKK